jgi:hypothetical protein
MINYLFATYFYQWSKKSPDRIRIIRNKLSSQSGSVIQDNESKDPDTNPKEIFTDPLHQLRRYPDYPIAHLCPNTQSDDF